MAARDLHYLAAAMRGYAGSILSGTDRVVSQVAGAVLVEVVRGTPVDTGFARSNWIVSIGSANGKTRAAFAPYPKYSGPKINESANADSAISDGLQKIGLFGLTSLGSPGSKVTVTASDAEGTFSLDVKQNRVIFIQNNVDYIGDLNDGTSRQAPAMFVQKAVLIGVSVVANGVAKVIF